MALLFFFISLVILFFLSRRLTQVLSRLLVHVFKSHTVAIYLLSFLFLPGVILHELSHLLVANLLFVPTGEIEFLPEIRGNEVKMGSVAIAKTDPLRRFLIGIAPLLGGLGMLFLVFWYVPITSFSWESVVLFYVVFEVGNTMFSSNKDMEGGIEFLLAIGVLGLLLQLLGIPVGTALAAFFRNAAAGLFFLHVSIFLSIAVGLDVLAIVGMLGVLKVVKH